MKVLLTLQTLKGLRNHQGSPDHSLRTVYLMYILNYDGLYGSFCSSQSRDTWVLVLCLSDLMHFLEEAAWSLVCPVLPSAFKA